MCLKTQLLGNQTVVECLKSMLVWILDTSNIIECNANIFYQKRWLCLGLEGGLGVSDKGLLNVTVEVGLCQIVNGRKRGLLIKKSLLIKKAG